MLAKQWGHIWKTWHKVSTVPNERTRQPLWVLHCRQGSDPKEAHEGDPGFCLCKKEGLRSNCCHSPPGGCSQFLPPRYPQPWPQGSARPSATATLAGSAGSTPATLSDLQLDRQVGAVTAPLLRWVEQLMWEWDVCSRGQRRYTMGCLGPHPHLPKNHMTRSDGNKVWKTIIWHIF